MELIYARWLSWCTRVGLTALALAFVAYLSGLAEPLIPLEHLPQVWSLPLERYLAASGAPTGWQWLRVAAKGDYANLAGIAMLGLVTVVCYVRLLAALLRRGERALALIAALQIAVLLAAAAGLLTGGH
jgi:Na+(H+)/acetate symporter ActP